MNNCKEKVFIDTSGFFELIAKDSKNYTRATNIWNKFQTNNKYILFTTDYIIDEALTLAQIKIRKEVSIELGEIILNSRILNIGRIDAAIWEKSWEMFKKYKDKDYSFTDCTSFAFMKINGIKKAFAFDEHFRHFGFELVA